MSGILLWNELKAGKMYGYTFNRQKPILNFIADFYCKPLNLVIEIDGASHFSEEAIAKDKERDRQMNVIGLRVLRILDSDVRKDMQNVLRVIEIAVLTPPNPLKEGEKTPPNPLKEGEKTPPNPLKDGEKTPPFKKGGWGNYLTTPFNETKYNDLLEGLEISILKLSEVKNENKDFRFDSEYYQKEYIANEILLQSNFKIADFLKNDIKNIKQIKLNKNFNYLEISNVSLTNLTYNTVVIDFNEIPDRATYVLKNNDVVVSTVRPNRNAVALIRNSKRIIGTSGFTVLRANNKILPEYLFAFCKTKYFITKLIRENTASMYPAVNDNDVLNVTLPIFSNNFNNEIKKLINNASNNLENSKTLYATAEQTLLQLLGLNNWQPTEKNTTVKSFKTSFVESGRLDAEYYQPKYDEIENKIINYGFVALREISSNISTGFPYDSSRYSESEGIHLLRINNLAKNDIDLSNAIRIPFADASLSPKDKVEKGDILISMSGTIGLTAYIRNEITAFVNQRIMKIKPINFNGDVLALIINSIVGKMQLDRVGTGGVQTNLSNSDILNIKIPTLPISEQKKLSEQIQQSFKLRQESIKLIEIAKQAVEMAIEKDEDAAMKRLAEVLI